MFTKMILTNINMELDRAFPSIVSMIIFITIAVFLFLIKHNVQAIEESLNEHIDEWKKFRDKLTK